jgi:hypothetical protein
VHQSEPDGVGRRLRAGAAARTRAARHSFGRLQSGTSPAGCEARLVYNAAIDYGRRSFSDESIQYLSIIDLTLIQNGRILVTARYQTGGLNTDRFSSASVKLGGLIERMVVDRTDFARQAQQQQTLQTSQSFPSTH